MNESEVLALSSAVSGGLSEADLQAWQDVIRCYVRQVVMPQVQHPERPLSAEAMRAIVAGLVEIAWVFVRDRTGTRRDEDFFSTDPGMSPVTMVEAYAGRWNLETTFQEARCFLGLESTRGWCRRTVLRAAPCLLRLYTVVALLYRDLPVSKRMGRVEWPGKTTVTFSDALTCVRRWLWRE